MAILNGNFKNYKLENGLVVALQNTPTQTISSKLRVNYGAYHEREDEKGLAHFLEHCLITGGSSKYKPTESDKIRGDFGYFNGQTNIGRTIFYANMLPEDLTQWLDLISDSLFCPSFDETRIEGERERVLREIEDSKSNPYFSANRYIFKELYRGHPKGILLLGDEKIIREASKKKIGELHKRGYTPSNMDLILVGNLPENTKELIVQYFGKYKKGHHTRVNFSELGPLEKQTVVHIYAPDLYNKENPKASSASLNLSLVVAPETHPDNFALKIISHILGGNSNSRFFKNIGLAKGLAYNYLVGYDGYYNGGLLGINASVPAVKINESLDAIFEEIGNLRKEEIGEEELNSAKKTAKFNIAKLSDSNEGHIYTIERKLDNGRSVEQLIEGFNKLTPDFIKKVAIKYLPANRQSGKYTLGIGDPLKQ